MREVDVSRVARKINEIVGHRLGPAVAGVDATLDRMFPEVFTHLHYQSSSANLAATAGTADQDL